MIPAMITGTTWAVAFLCWLYANSVLGEAFTFPILATAPSVLGCVVGIYFFKEVSDKARSKIKKALFRDSKLSPHFPSLFKAKSSSCTYW